MRPDPSRARATRHASWASPGSATGISWINSTLWSAATLLAPLAASPSSLFGSVVATAAHAFPPCIALGFLRAVGLHRPRVEAALIASIVVGASVRSLVAPVWIPVVDNLWWVVNAGIGLYLVRLAVVAVRHAALPVPRLLLGAAVIVIGFGVGLYFFVSKRARPS